MNAVVGFLVRLSGGARHVLRAMRADLAGKLETTRVDILRKLDLLEKSLSSAKSWALTLYFAFAGSMFFALARGFKWI